MANLYGPRIVTDGLICYLDAANRKSYPGTGNTWYDLMGRSTVTSFSSTNMDSSNWSSAYGGMFSFDGSNEYMDFYAPITSSTITVEVIAKMKDTYSAMLFGFQSYDFYFYYGGNYFGYNTGNGDVWGYSPYSLIHNKWIHYTCEMRSDVAPTNNKVYINSQQLTLSQKLGTTSATRGFNSGNGRISSWKNDLNFATYIDLSVFKIYNRSLSQSEITQNYNALKGRFGL